MRAENQENKKRITLTTLKTVKVNKLYQKRTCQLTVVV